MRDVTGQVAAITGAGSGMGRALAEALARDGCAVALSDVDDRGLAQTAHLVEQLGGRVHTAHVDVSDARAVDAWARQVAAELGGVGLLFNNAGVAASSTIAELDLEDLRWVMGVNFWGVVHGTAAFLPLLAREPAAHLVNTSSVFGLLALPTMGPYNASKFAVRGYTEALQQELAGSSIHVTLVLPGGVKTGIAARARIAHNVAGRYVTDEEGGRRAFEALLRTTPERAAEVILRGVRQRRRRVLIGRDAHVIDWVQRLLPVRYQGLTRALTTRVGRDSHPAGQNERPA